ncbi:Tctex-1 family-domain-containing protein [Jimgerdemannia flammicorona]|uniref:Tctex-1 family-domain-containing protein n=1 Tax=Jimgerdemannia flammicorona TaxID=994334 RepID=A0A433DMC2_9FUNG|nr:Tctex-1 family-domain-containing protein [Jimgerdemannia flammicorona]
MNDVETDMTTELSYTKENSRVFNVEETVESVLGDSPWQYAKVPEWTDNITGNVLKRLDKDKGFKYIVTCVFVQKNRTGFYAKSQVFWDETTDGIFTFHGLGWLDGVGMTTTLTYHNVIGHQKKTLIYATGYGKTQTMSDWDRSVLFLPIPKEIKNVMQCTHPIISTIGFLFFSFPHLHSPLPHPPGTTSYRHETKSMYTIISVFGLAV